LFGNSGFIYLARVTCGSG